MNQHVQTRHFSRKAMAKPLEQATFLACSGETFAAILHTVFGLSPLTTHLVYFSVSW